MNLAGRPYWILLLALFWGLEGSAQVSIPWSASLNIDFGEGEPNPGPPLSVGHTDFIFTSDPCPRPGYYTVVNAVRCSVMDSLSTDDGHIFDGPRRSDKDIGYMMVLTQMASPDPKIVFSDTLRNLCGGNPYLFWAAMSSLTHSRCIQPNFSLNVETLSGTLIQSIQTGNIGGAGDRGTWYPGFFDPQRPMPPTPFKYYGGEFTLPPGVSEVVVKIIANPSTSFPSCLYSVAIDNININPRGMTPEISVPGFVGAILTASCFEGNIPVVLEASLDGGYKKFGSTDFINYNFASPAVQWQLSRDRGFTWTDLPGETGLTLSHVFSIPDTFFIRLRTSEAPNINNLNCSVISNVITVQVNGLPTQFSLSSNSPVCTDGDITFDLQGGATYTIMGPNGYSDNSPYPHIYHPLLADSGWYLARIFTLGGCQVTDSTFVRVIGPNLKVSEGQAACYGKPVQLQASGGDQYQWSPAAGLSDAGISNPLATPHKSTLYQVKVTDQSGCSAYGNVLVTLRDSLLKAAIAGPGSLCPMDIGVFRDTSIGKLASWQWDFGNGQTSHLSRPVAQHYGFDGNTRQYTIMLRVTDSAGCADTAYRQLTVAGNCFIAVPSAFTPNNDGKNDFLYPLNAYKATELDFRVYDRSGQLVFETRDWTRKWDGRFRGAPAPPGTYVWTLRYNDAHHQPVSLRGTTLLIR